MPRAPCSTGRRLPWACVAAISLAAPGASRAAEAVGVVAVAPPPGPTPRVAELTEQLRSRIARLAPGTLDGAQTAERMTGPAPEVALADLSHATEAARRAYLDREYDRSLGMLRGVAADLEQLPDDPAVFDLWTKVMTRIARTEMDLGHLDAARASIERVLRVAPDLAMDRSLHPARFVGEVESVRAAVKAGPSGTLVVESSAAGARVLVNGRDAGTAPVRLTLPRGSYRITGTKGRARVRSIAEVGEQEHEVRLDFSIDEALRPELGPGVALRPEHRQGDLVAIGRYLGLDQIVAVGTTGDGDASYVVAELHVVRGDAPERRARVRLADGALPDGAAAALAEFLVTGRVTSPLVEIPGEARVPPSPPPDAPRLRPFVGGGLLVPAAPERFTRAWRPGMALGVGGEYALANVAALWGTVEYARILVREDGAKETVTVYGPITSVRGGDFTMLSLRLGVRLRRPSGRLRPYADLGLGIDRISTDTIELEYEDPTTHQAVMLTPFRIDDTKARALTAGLGVQYAPRPSLTMFADVHATFLDAPDQCYPRFDLCFLTGGETRYGSIRVGVLFR